MGASITWCINRLTCWASQRIHCNGLICVKHGELEVELANIHVCTDLPRLPIRAKQHLICLSEIPLMFFSGPLGLQGRGRAHPPLRFMA